MAYYLLEVVNTNNTESPAIYPKEGDEPYANVTELLADYETKLGADMKADAYKVAYLLAFDGNGVMYAQEYNTKDESIALSPRLISVKHSKTQGEIVNQSKEINMNALEADYHSQKGSAMKNTDISTLVQMCFDGKSVAKFDKWQRPTEPVVEG